MLVRIIFMILTLWDPKALVEGDNLVSERFIRDYVKFYAINRPVILSSTDGVSRSDGMTDVLRLLATRTAGAFVSYGSSEIPLIMALLFERQKYRLVDGALFVGVGHDELIKSIADRSQSYFSRVPSLVHRGQHVALNFLLTTRMYFYEDVNATYYALSEDYAIRGGPRISREVGYWSADTGVRIEKPYIWNRRTDLHGITFRNYVMPDLRICRVEFADKEVASVSGFFPDILRELREELNFSTLEFVPSSGQWGSFLADAGNDSDGTLVGALRSGLAEISTTGLIRTPDRDAAVAFNIPLRKHSTTLLAPATEVRQVVSFGDYTVIFYPETWALIFAGSACLAATFFALVMLGGQSFHVAGDSERFHALNSLSVPLLLLLQIAYPMETPSLSSRLAFFSCCLFTYVVYAYYTCDLTARMTSGPSEIPVKSFADASRHGYQVVVIENSAMEEMLSGSKEGTGRRDYYDDHIAGNPGAYVSSSVEGKQVMLEETKTLFFDLELIAEEDRRFTALKISDSYPAYASFGLPKDSELRGLFNFRLLRLQENGLMEKMRLRWWPPRPKDPGVSAEAMPVGYSNAVLPFLLLGTGIIFALLTVIAEVTKRVRDRAGSSKTLRLSGQPFAEPVLD